MSQFRLALLGFGNVGRALVRLLQRKEGELREKYDITFCVTGIATRRHGHAINPIGLNLEKAMELVKNGESLSTISTTSISDSIGFIHAVQADVLFENSPVNHLDGEPAVTHLRTALECGMHAITANKGPVVHAYHELTDLAQVKGRKFYFESTVMDGAPIFSLFRSTLPATQVVALRGILNSTTNLILGRMENGESFEEAIKYCQEIGLAETDPSGDVDGWDAAIKVAALATVLMGVPLKPQEVNRIGIRSITPRMTMEAKADGKRWKLVCTADREGNTVKGRVAPELVPSSSPLYSVEGSSSIVEFQTDTLSSLSILEGNPGPETTAYGLMADFINAVKAR
jgi:homoserine dehydrogenase